MTAAGAAAPKEGARPPDILLKPCTCCAASTAGGEGAVRGLQVAKVEVGGVCALEFGGGVSSCWGEPLLEFFF